MSAIRSISASRHQFSLLVRALCIAALAVLAFEPVRWLVRSWYAPGYDSAGGVVFAVVVALFIWSGTSAVRPDAARHFRRLPILLLLASFLVRLASQVLAINVLGALMLALDVYALALMLRLHDRTRAVSPALLAALFCFALPLEPMLQRSVGFLLQQASAAGACSLLWVVHSEAGCEGVRLFIDKVDVLVDLPCSGARLLILLLTGFFALAAVNPLPRSFSRRQGARTLASGFALVVLVSWLANTLRILLLAWGLRYADVIGINVMRDPWHSAVGLVLAALGMSTMFWWFRRLPKTGPANQRSQESVVAQHGSFESKAVAMPGNELWRRPGVQLACASGALVVALLLVSLRPSPIDVSRALAVSELPVSLAGVARSPLPLSDLEQNYFETFGGAAARAGYGPHSLLLVQTTSPLRHLHAPDVCFSASGHDVTYEGVDFNGVPTAVYRSRSPAGEELRVRVQFVAASGRTAHSVSEVVWHWLRDPTQSWTMVQTVSPWHDQGTESEIFRAAVNRALNLGSSA